MTDNVTIELIANPTVTREVTRKAGDLINKNVWRIVGTAEPDPEVKKKVVAPVAAKPSEPVIEPNGLLTSLRGEYEQVSGKAPDGRWNIARLTKEIKGFKPQEA